MTSRWYAAHHSLVVSGSWSAISRDLPYPKERDEQASAVSGRIAFCDLEENATSLLLSQKLV
jgi:hypothetical protein